MNTEVETKLIKQAQEYIKKDMSAMKTVLEKVDSRLSSIEKQLSMYASFVKILKFFAAVAVALLAFKFGDVSSLWTEFRGK